MGFFANIQKWVEQWVDCEFLGAKVGQMRQNPISIHFKPISGNWEKKHFYPF